jgi:hypothetical protein
MQNIDGIGILDTVKVLALNSVITSNASPELCIQVAD